MRVNFQNEFNKVFSSFLDLKAKSESAKSEKKQAEISQKRLDLEERKVANAEKRTALKEQEMKAREQRRADIKNKSDVFSGGARRKSAKSQENADMKAIEALSNAYAQKEATMDAAAMMKARKNNPKSFLSDWDGDPGPKPQAQTGYFEEEEIGSIGTPIPKKGGQ